MPLVDIELAARRDGAEIEAIATSVGDAMVATLGVPERDRFICVNERRPEHFSFNRGYLEVERSDAFVFVRLTLAAGRTTEAKQAFYADLCRRLVDAVGLRSEDLAVCLVENAREDWSFGHGRASYLELDPADWR